MRTFDAVIAVICYILGEESIGEVDENSSLEDDIGMDNLDIADTIEYLEDLCDISLDYPEGIATLGQLCERVESALALKQ